MKHLFTTLLFFSIIGEAVAEYEYPYDRRSINNTQNITIRGYLGGDKETLIIPNQIHDSIVTKISTILKATNKTTINNILLPPNIEITGTLTKNRTDLEFGVIETGTTFSSDGTAIAFYFDSSFDKNKASLKSIFTFGSKHDKSKIIGRETADNLLLLGEIEISYNDNSKEVIYMYNWGYGSDEVRNKHLVDASKYKLLLFALGNHSTKEILSIDLSHLEDAFFSFDDFDLTSELPREATVIINENTIYNPTIPDLTDYTLPSIDLYTTIHYSRSNTKDWNSVCLPFDLNESDFPAESNTKIYTISGADDQSIKLTRTESIVAGTPCFIHSDAESWNLTLENREIKSTTQAGTIEIDGWKMFGSFTREIIGADKYKLNEDGKSISPTASVNAHVSPFRCYLECTSASGAPERFAVSIDGEEQSITLTKEDSDTTDQVYFDLMGHPVQNNNEPRMIKGRNIIIR